VLANYQQTKGSSPPNINEPIGFDQLPDGRIIQTVRDGRVRLHDPATAVSTVILDLRANTYTNSEDGMYGPAVDTNSSNASACVAVDDQAGASGLEHAYEHRWLLSCDVRAGHRLDRSDEVGGAGPGVSPEVVAHGVLDVEVRIVGVRSPILVGRVPELDSSLPALVEVRQKPTSTAGRSGLLRAAPGSDELHRCSGSSCTRSRAGTRR